MSFSGDPTPGGSNNPYQAPASFVSELSPELAVDAMRQHELQKALRSFQGHCTALAIALGFFCVFVLIAFVMSFIVENDLEPTRRIVLRILFGVLGTLYGGLAVAIGMRQMWAVWIALAVFGLGIVGMLSSLNLCGLSIFAVLFAIGATVLGKARHLRREGVPLTAKIRSGQIVPR